MALLGLYPYLLALSWPFVLVVTPLKVTRKGVPCCSGCGKIDHSLRVVEYTIGFCLFGLIPIKGGYRRVFCSVCRGFIYRLAVILENVLSMIFIPVGTVLGVVWLFKNLSRKTLLRPDSKDILLEISKECDNQNDLISKQKISETINLI